MLFVGNDIVDLKFSGCIDQHKNDRFIARVFTANEKEKISTSSHPNLLLWMMWAAKETAYKIISKIKDPPVFSHKQFITNINKITFSKDKVTAAGQVQYEDYSVALKFKGTEDYIHAKGFFPKKAAKEEDYLVRSTVKQLNSSSRKITKWQNYFSIKELKTIHNEESKWVRLHAKKEIAKKLDLEQSRIQIIRPIKGNKTQPPIVLLDNKKSEIDISLSHHGRWLAWSFSAPNRCLNVKL